MDAALRLRFRHALHAVHAAFKPEARKGVRAADDEIDLADAAKLGLAAVDDLNGEALPLGVHFVNPEKIGGEKGEYPYLLFNPHYFRRSHSVFDNCPWLREAWANPVFLNASDAKAKGIKNGDTVRVWTKYGEVLRKACCMENLMPGEVGIPHGSWVRLNEKTGIDEGGADNFLTGNNISGIGVTSYNNNNCNFEKYNGQALEDDCKTDVRILKLG